MRDMKPQKLSFCTWIRAVSAIMILFCHYFQQNSNAYIRMFAQFLNIGVYLFFILSGFLAGYRGTAAPYHTWYGKRLKRIYFPFWLFLFVLAVVHITKDMHVTTLDWLMLILGLQGSIVGVWGAEQTWFISVLLLCYLITPAFSEILSKISIQRSKSVHFGFLLLFLFMPFVYALFPKPWVYTIFTPTSFYVIAFVVGRDYDPQKSVSESSAWICTGAIMFTFSLRLIARAMIDGSILYDRIIVPYTQFFAAGAIFCLFAVLAQNKRVPFPVAFISDISFEMYLYHYMFTVGPVSLFGCTPFWLMDCILVTGVVIAISMCCNKLTDIANRRIFRNKL